MTTSPPTASSGSGPALRDAIRRECERLEEDSLYSARGHFEASRSWGRLHLIVGVPTAVLAALASISAFNSAPELAGALSILVAALSAVSTFLNPAEKSQGYHVAGAAFNGVRTRARLLREVKALSTLTDDELAQLLEQLVEEKDQLNLKSPPIPRQAFERARKGIEAGEASYTADGGQRVLR